MKKRDVILIIVAITFGLLYNLYEKGEVSIFFFEGCSLSPNQLLDKRHPVPFPREATEYKDITAVHIDNPAGEVTVEAAPGGDNTTHLQPLVIVYHQDKEKAGSYNQQIKVQSWLEDTTLKVEVKPTEKFPYRRVRVQVKLIIPATVECSIRNRYGDIAIKNMANNIQISQRYGDIQVQHVTASLDIRSRFGKVELNDIGGNIDLDIQNCKTWITKGSSLKLRSAHSRLKIEGIQEDIACTYARYSTIDITGGRNLEIDAKHSRIAVHDVTKRVVIDNTHGSITMKNIGNSGVIHLPVGDSSNSQLIKLTTRNCRLKMKQVCSPYMVIKSRFGAVDLVEVSGGNLDVVVDNAELDLSFIDVKGRINITNRHSRIRVDYPREVSPSFNIVSDYGKIFNRTSSAYPIIKQKHKEILSQPGGTPEIIINNTYGDIVLDHFTPTGKIPGNPNFSPAPGTGKEKIDVELEEFNQTQTVGKQEELDKNQGNGNN